MPRSFRRCSALLLFLCAHTLFADDVSLRDPIDARVPQTVFDAWRSIDSRALNESEGGGPMLDFPSAPPSKARVDLFVKKQGEWHWLLSRAYSPKTALPVVPTDERIGGLVRATGHPGYAWGETWTGEQPASQTVAMQWFRSLDVYLPAAGSVALFLEGTREPRSAATRERTVRFPLVPFGRAFACFSNGQESTCIDVPQNATETRIAAPPARRTVRVFQTDHVLNATAKTPSLSAMQAKNLPLTTLSLNGWLAATLDDPAPLGELVLDFEAEGCAVTRFGAETLPPPPGYAVVAPCELAGVSVRPSLRGLGVPPEKQARLGVFREGPAIESRIPLAVAPRDADGDFHFPAIASGRYRLKLFSAMSTGHFVTATLETTRTTLVTFDAGPIVSGRVTLQTGGTTDQHAVVEVVRSVSIPTPDQVAKSGEDVADWVRATTADDDGNFAIVITVPGEYHLRAHWGSGIGTRDFVMPKPAKDVDLGEIQLVRAATVRGTVPDCPQGMMRMTSLPDLSKPLQMTAALVDTRTTISDPAGRFFFEGLAAGEWFLSARCGGQPVALQPQKLSLFPGQDLVVEAQIVR